MKPDAKDCPVCRSSVERRAVPGRDLLWEAIPFDELLDTAKARIGDCSSKTEEEIRRCAEAVVRSQICDCCGNEETVVAAVVDAFMTALGNPQNPT